MLISPTAQEAEEYIDFIYGLALDPARSGYPIYTDGIKTKEDFIESMRKGFKDAHRGNFLYAENGTACGWIQYSFLEADRYLQTEIFNISGSITNALSEFIRFCEANYGGYTLYLGFPAENREAISCLEAAGWTCIEKAYNDVIFFDSYVPGPEDDAVVRVDRENFADFRILHGPVEKDMYWNSDRLYAALDEWDIYLYYRDGVPSGAVYYTSDAVSAEIFGVDFRNERYDETVFKKLLTRVLNACKETGKKHMVCFNDDLTQKAILEMGFRCVGQYILHIREV